MELQIVRSGANVVITALNSSNVRLQTKTALGDPAWVNVPGLPENTNSFTIPAGEDAAFFRAEKLD